MYRSEVLTNSSTYSVRLAAVAGNLITLFATFPFEVLLGLLKALEELDRLNIVC